MRNRRQPSGALTGEIMPPERDAYGMTRRGDVPGMVTLNELGGALNIVQRVRAWGQAKGFAAAANMLNEFERSIRAKERTLAAMEDLAIQEARLSGENFAVLMKIAEREIDTRYADVSNRLAAEQARGRRADLEAQIEETRLKRILHREQERYNQVLDQGQPTRTRSASTAPKQSLADQITDLSKRLTEKQREFEALGDTDEAQSTVLLQEISMLLAELEALRMKHAQTL